MKILILITPMLENTQYFLIFPFLKSLERAVTPCPTSITQPCYTERATSLSMFSGVSFKYPQRYCTVNYKTSMHSPGGRYPDLFSMEMCHSSLKTPIHFQREVVWQKKDTHLGDFFIFFKQVHLKKNLGYSPEKLRKNNNNNNNRELTHVQGFCVENETHVYGFIVKKWHIP